jgi:hypothetical protein
MATTASAVWSAREQLSGPAAARGELLEELAFNVVLLEEHPGMRPRRPDVGQKTGHAEVIHVDDVDGEIAQGPPQDRAQGGRVPLGDQIRHTAAAQPENARHPAGVPPEVDRVEDRRHRGELRNRPGELPTLSCGDRALGDAEQRDAFHLGQ